MNLGRNLIQGAAGGLLRGATLGLLEAVYLASQGAPDLFAVPYAIALYALIGLPLGLGAGVVLAIYEKIKPIKKEGAEAFSFVWGQVGAWVPMAGFVGLYLGNKVVYAEQGVPTEGKLALLGLLAVVAALDLTVGRKLVAGPFKGLLKGPGVLGAVLAAWLVGVVVWQVGPGGDPRDAFDTGKKVPAALVDAPNVLVIAVDTLRADHLGTYGKDGNPSPTIDALGADGIVFEQGFAAASWTRSSFASLWSSRIPSSHDADTKASRLADDVDLLSEVLQDAGVSTANLANNINVTATFNFDQGWDAFVYEAPDYPYGATESVFELTFYKVVHKVSEKVNGKVFGGHKAVEQFYQPAEVVLDDAKDFIDANRDARWMLGVHLMEPHDPYFEHPYLMGQGDAEFNGVGFARAEVEHPDPADADYLKGVYLDEIRHMDRKLAPFVQWLKDEGLYDTTTIVLTADHGEEFAEHGGFWHGTTLYEEQIHVPLIVKPAGDALAGVRVGWQARTLDIAPTITAMMGIAPSPQWEGRDLLADVTAEIGQAQAAADEIASLEAQIAELTAAPDPDAEPVADAPEAAPEDEAAALSEAQARLAELTADPDPCNAYDAPFERPVVSEQDFEGNVLSSLRKKGFKLIRANAGNPRGLDTSELYDIVADPGETTKLDAKGSVCGRYLDGLPKGYGEELDTVIEQAKQRAIDGGQGAELSAGEILKLCQLGYMSGEDCCKAGYEPACE